MTAQRSLRFVLAALLAALLSLTLCSQGFTAAASPVNGAVLAQPTAGAAGPVAPTLVQAKAKAKGKAKPARPGKYKGHFYTDQGERLESFTFRVSKDGKKLKKFRAYLDVICSYYPPTVETHPMGFPKTKIKRNHTFKKVWKPTKKIRIVLKGKFKGKRLISGRISYLVGICVRTGDLKAKRVGK